MPPMTLAQDQAHVCGVVPHEHDPQFVAQHMSAYIFAQPLAAGRRVLEIGFGSGYGTAYLAQTAREVIGIDMAPGNIPRAAAAYPKANLRFLQMDATRLGFASASFDLVCSFQVIEHIPEPRLPAYCAEICRVLRPDGVACISTLNLAHNMKPGKRYEKLLYHEKEFTAPELQRLLEQAFAEVQLRGLHPTVKHRVCRRLKKWGLDRLGPALFNPIARFYQHASPKDFVVTSDISPSALDLFALCRPSRDSSAHEAP